MLSIIPVWVYIPGVLIVLWQLLKLPSGKQSSVEASAANVIIALLWPAFMPMFLYFAIKVWVLKVEHKSSELEFMLVLTSSLGLSTFVLMLARGLV